MIKNKYFNHDDLDQNRINDEMYITEYYPEEFYSDYNPELWELLGVEDKFTPDLTGLPKDICKDIYEYHKSFGDEAFDQHWLSCSDFMHNVKLNVNSGNQQRSIVEKIKSLGNPGEMRLLLWFSQ